MWYLYLDESGDLGFDFVNKKPSRHFVIVILAIRTRENQRILDVAVRRTLKKKVNYKKKRNLVNELKGTQLNLINKKYFHEQIKVPFAVYSIILNKRRVFEHLANDKSRVYNYVAKLLIEKLPFEKAETAIKFYVDKSKGKPEIKDFNDYLKSHLEGRLSPKVRLDILHEDSCNMPGLQAADLFAYGIFRKYERKDEAWYSIFKDNIQFERMFLP